MSTPEISWAGMPACEEGCTCGEITLGKRQLDWLVEAAYRAGRESADDVKQVAIDAAVESQLETYWENIYGLLDDEKSKIWLAIADTMDGLRPGLSPYDRREAVAAIVSELKRVLDDC